jgi:hypothetical protein
MKHLTLKEAKEKYGKSEGAPFEQVHKIFDILIDNTPYPVYSIPGYEHQLGKSNGCPDTWWLDYSDYEATSDEDGDIHEPCVRELIPYIDLGSHRICWEIRYRQYNRLKYKWDEWDIRNGGTCEMFANGKLVYKFSAREIGYALARAQSLEVILLEHPFDFLNQEKENGRKIWYYGLPATVRASNVHPGEIGIVPDYSYMSKEEWWDSLKEKKKKITPKNHKDTQDDSIEKEELEDDRRFESWISHGDALWDGMIWWFRD